MSTKLKYEPTDGCSWMIKRYSSSFYGITVMCMTSGGKRPCRLTILVPQIRVLRKIRAGIYLIAPDNVAHYARFVHGKFEVMLLFGLIGVQGYDLASLFFFLLLQLQCIIYIY